LRTSTFLRAGAVLTASALAFSLGAGPVSAAETTATTATSTEPSTGSFSTSSTTGTAGVPTSAVTFTSSVITSAATTRFYGTSSFNVEDYTQATVTINGRAKGVVPVLFSATAGDAAIAVDVPRAWGSGKVRLNISGAVSNVFYARKEVRSKATFPLKIRRVNSKITFRAYGVKIVNPTTGKYQSVKRVKLQQLKNGKWKTKKTIKLPRTSTQQGFQTVKTGKI
jgi:hypothetical protein